MRTAAPIGISRTNQYPAMPMIKKNRPAAVSFGLFTLTCIPLLDFGCAGNRRGSGGAADGHAAANIEDLAGNERGGLAHEEGGGVGDVGGGAEPADRGGLDDRGRGGGLPRGW